MADLVLCRLFLCKCGKPMQIPIDELQRLTVDPADSSIHASAIAVLCPHCTTIHKYTLDGKVSDRVGADRLEPQDHISKMGRAEWLRCDDEHCTTRLPLFGIEIPPTYSEVAGKDLRNAFPWVGLTCPTGHNVPFPQS